jgi:hypothetical protein
MLSVSAAMLVSSTFAWFTMNKEVKATNMQVQAKADQGLLINEVSTADDANWDALATTNQTGGIKLHATSTAETKTWYAAYSKAKSDAAAATDAGASANLADGYKTLGTTTGYVGTLEQIVAAEAGTTAKQEVYYIDADQDRAYDNGEGYYVKYTYYLKSSGDEIALSNTGAAKSLYIKDLDVTGNTNSANLDMALRVAIVVNNKAYIYAPLYADADIPKSYVNATTETKPIAKDVAQATAMTSLPKVTEAGTPVYVYIYFEGEDTNLKTDNVVETLDDLTVSFKFAINDHAATVTDNGVTVPTN